MLQCLKSCFVNIYPKKSVEKHTADIYKHRFLFRIITWKSQHQRCCVSKPRGFGQNGLNWLHFLVLGPWVELILALYILFIEVQVICVCSLWHPDLVALRCTCFLSMFGRLEPCSYPKCMFFAGNAFFLLVHPTAPRPQGERLRKSLSLGRWCLAHVHLQNQETHKVCHG